MNRIHEAIIFATQKHAGQIRKGTDVPYIVHPMEVMQILTAEGFDDNVIIAGILHDVLEDTSATPSEILELFGEDVLKIVIAESEDKSKSWKERKQATIDHLERASKDVKIVCLADKLSNLRSMAADLETVGEKLWERFNAPKTNIEWYYRKVFETVKLAPELKMNREFKALLELVFGDSISY